MKRTLLSLLAVAIGLFAGAAPMLAHHSFAAEFDGAMPLDLTGTVTKVDWVNPHSWIYIDVKSADGTVVNWGLETGPPNVLYRAGWRRDSIKPGDTITVHGFAAKDRSHTLAARQVRTPDGRKLFAGSPNDNGPKQ
jgi:hypothetical protein